MKVIGFIVKGFVLLVLVLSIMFTAEAVEFYMNLPGAFSVIVTIIASVIAGWLMTVRIELEV